MKIINGEMYYNLTEVGQLISKTKVTLYRWYEFEEMLPEEERVLPKIVEVGKTKTKYILASELEKFNLFKTIHKKGSMNKVSEKYNGALTKPVK